jgi:multicomponent K+:H+ antiporter subunit F
MNPLLAGALAFALGCYAIASVLVVTRLVRGPRAQDRVFALDLLYLHAMLVMLVLGILHRSDMYFEAALLIALFSFVSSSAMAKFILRGEVIE